MKRKWLSIVVMVALVVSMMSTVVMAYTAEVSSMTYVTSSNSYTGTTSCTRADGSTHTVYIFPAGTTFSHRTEGGVIVFMAWTLESLNNGTASFYDPDYTATSSSAPAFAPEAGVVYLLEESNTMDWFQDMYIMVEGSSTQPQPEPEPEVEQPSDWAQGYVKAAVEANIVPEALQSKYTQDATRGEFCALAVQLYETATGKTIQERAKFTDTTDVNVEKAAALGVISGAGDGKANPEGTITREQAAVMLSSLARACGKPLSEGESAFADRSSVAGWAVAAVDQVAANGIMSGTGENRFSPQLNYSREQSITTMLSLFNYVK